MFMPFSCGTKDSDCSISDSPEPELKTVGNQALWLKNNTSNTLVHTDQSSMCGFNSGN
jgi:hypothetical protein